MDRPIELTAESLWNEVAGRLKGALNETTYRTWFAEAEGAELSDDAFVLGVPERLHARVDRGALPRPDRRGRPRRHRPGAPGCPLRDGAAPGATPAPAEAPKGRSGGAADSGMNPKYTFDLFVIGSSNRFAHAAALAVAEAPASLQPALHLRRKGLGKTHLMQAIAQYVGEHSGDLFVRYVTRETFMNDFINSLRDKRIEEIKSATGPTTCCSSTTCSSSSTRSGSRRSSSTPSTRSTRPAPRSSCPRTGRRATSPRWRSGCARASSGG